MPGISKAKGRRSNKDKGYYTAQFTNTAINKSRRAKKRQRKVEHWRKVKAEQAAKVNATVGMGQQSDF